MLVTLLVIANLAVVLSSSIVYEDVSVASAGAKDVVGGWWLTLGDVVEV
jgi:hypothetical protein